VQGVGFRPYVYVTACALGLSGSVSSTSSGVVVEVEADPDSVESFGRRFAEDAPPLAQVERVRRSDLVSRGSTGITIEVSAGGAGQTLTSPDVAVCADCLDELADPTDRRYRHPFITCTNGGPRSSRRRRTTGPRPPWPGSRCAPPAGVSTTTRRPSLPRPADRLPRLWSDH